MRLLLAAVLTVGALPQEAPCYAPLGGESRRLLLQFAGQEPATVYRYSVSDAAGKKEIVDSFEVFAAELAEAGFDRFTRHELARLPFEFLFPRVPENAKKGTKWAVEATPAADAFRYTAPFDGSNEPLHLRVAGTYELVDAELRVVKGTFAITRMKFAPLDEKKTGRRGELKESKDVIGGLAVELRHRADGLLTGASYRYSIKAPDQAVYLKNSHYARELVASGYEHSRTVALTDERTVNRKQAREAAAKAVERARKWLLTQQEGDGGFWNLEQSGKGMRHSEWKVIPTSDVVRALRASGMTPAEKPMQAAIAFLRSTQAMSGGPQMAVGTIPLAYQPVTLEKRRSEFVGGDEPMAAVDEQWLAATMKKMTDGRATAHGLWSHLDLNGDLATVLIDRAGEIALSVHEATLLGAEVPVEVWKRAIATLKGCAIEMGKAGRVEVTLAEKNSYEAVLTNGEHRELAWPRLASESLPGGFRPTWGALIVLAVARWQLARAGQLDAGTKAVLDDLQRGGWAWVSANYRARWIDRSAFTSDVAGGGGLESVSLATAYGVVAIRGRDPVVEMTVRLEGEQRAEGGFGVGWSRKAVTISATATVVAALTEFVAPLWMK